VQEQRQRRLYDHRLAGRDLRRVRQASQLSAKYISKRRSAVRCRATATVNATLTIGSATEQMTVEANAGSQVETQPQAPWANVVEGNQVRETASQRTQLCAV